jgi:hypothetical protein
MDSTPPKDINNLLKDAKDLIESFDQSLDILYILEDFLCTTNNIIENIEIDMKYHVEFQG